MSKLNLFDTISGVYSLFFNYQKKKFENAVRKAKPQFDISSFDSTLDVGCGTGALCSILSQSGLKITGIDNAQKMIDIAKRKNPSIDFIQSDASKKLPFDDDSFDFSIASYVLHGIKPAERKKMLLEMKRVSKQYVILYEFSKNRKITTDIIEYLEGGNYFTFLKNIESELYYLFDKYSIIEIDKDTFWYVIKA